jgi:2-oxoglutarate ferredoxin oxidoreductase subunit alpha
MSERVLMTGNEAVGEGAIRGGCDCYFGYPITPQNDLTAYLARHMPERGRVFIQAESEVAAINMVFGAAAAGKRAMTSSSSPGISLKQEGISYLAGARLPAVIVNVQRGGPGLGSIEPSQADYFQAVKGGGHGDYRLVTLAPASVQEMHDFTAAAFDIADRYRNPVMILTDGRLGQMMEPLSLWTGTPERVAKPWALTGARGRPQNIVRSYFGLPGALENHNATLLGTTQQMQAAEVRSECLEMDDAEVMLVAFGTCARLCREVMRAERGRGRPVGMVRPISLWPFPRDVLASFGGRLRACVVVEMNAGQMVEDVRLALNGAAPVLFHGRAGGGVPATSDIAARVDEAFAL